MEDKTWELLMSQLNDIKSDIVDIKAENKKQTSMINGWTRKRCQFCRK